MTKTGFLPLPTQPMAVQIENKAAWNDARDYRIADFYTFGYTRRTMRDTIEVLSHAGVATVVDVREYPVSQYRPEFSKTNLERHLKRFDIGYVHLPDLGVPRDVRARAIGKPDRDAIWDWYDLNVIPTIAGKNLTWFFNALVHPVALMCVELDPTSCHRHRLTIALERHGLYGYDL